MSTSKNGCLYHVRKMYIRVLYAIVINLPLLMLKTIGLLQKAGVFGVNHRIKIPNCPKSIEIVLQRIPALTIGIQSRPVQGLLLRHNIGKQ